MKDHELLELGALFLAALKLRHESELVADIDVFTMALLKITSESQNATAQSFYLYDGPAGCRALDFTQMFSLLHAATYVSWVSPRFRSFINRMSSGMAVKKLSSIDSKKRVEIEAIADAYLKGLSGAGTCISE